MICSCVFYTQYEYNHDFQTLHCVVRRYTAKYLDDLKSIFCRQPLFVGCSKWIPYLLIKNISYFRWQRMQQWTISVWERGMYSADRALWRRQSLLARRGRASLRWVILLFYHSPQHGTHHPFNMLLLYMTSILGRMFYPNQLSNQCWE